MSRAFLEYIMVNVLVDFLLFGLASLRVDMYSLGRNERSVYFRDKVLLHKASGRASERSCSYLVRFPKSLVPACALHAQALSGSCALGRHALLLRVVLKFMASLCAFRAHVPLFAIIKIPTPTSALRALVLWVYACPYSQ